MFGCVQHDCVPLGSYSGRGSSQPGSPSSAPSAAHQIPIPNSNISLPSFEIRFQFQVASSKLNYTGTQVHTFGFVAQHVLRTLHRDSPFLASAPPTRTCKVLSMKKKGPAHEVQREGPAHEVHEQTRSSSRGPAHEVQLTRSSSRAPLGADGTATGRSILLSWRSPPRPPS